MAIRIKTSSAVGEFLETVYSRVHAPNKAVFGCAGLFLGLNKGLPQNYKKSNSQGIELNEETILGEDLPPVLRAALNFRCEKTLSEEEYKKYFDLYFDYGCTCLQDIWTECEESDERFISEILKVYEAGAPIEASKVAPAPKQSVVKREVKVKLLADGEPWVINHTGTRNNSLMVTSGKTGAGKTQFVFDLLTQISRQGVRFLFLDLKGELDDKSTEKKQVENRKAFFEATNPGYVRLIDDRLPINPIRKGDTPAQKTQIASEIVSLIRAYGPALGPKQEGSILDAFKSLSKPDFYTLKAVLEQRGEVNTTPYSIINKIVELNLFASCNDAIPLENWLSRSQVINFKELGNDNQTIALAVAFLLNAITTQLNQELPVENEIQPLRMVLFLDEAHVLLPKEGKANLLGPLARKGRSWGLPLWIASQDADALITTGTPPTDFTELADYGVHFSPETITSPSQQKKILGNVFNGTLQKGEAIFKSGGKITQGKARQFIIHKGQP